MLLSCVPTTLHCTTPHSSPHLTTMIPQVAAGTNNARVASLLRNLASYYAKEAHHLFLVRVAQGIVMLGKGHLTLSPLHMDRQLLSPVALGGLLVVLFAAMDMEVCTVWVSNTKKTPFPYRTQSSRTTTTCCTTLSPRSTHGMQNEPFPLPAG